MPMIMIGDWKATLNMVDGMRKNAGKAAAQAVRDEAFLFQRQVVKAFREQGSGGKKWKPLNVITLALRRGASKVGGQGSRGTNALVRSGSLRASVKVEQVTPDTLFVGVKRAAGQYKGTSGKGGAAIVDVGSIHETGHVIIPITDKMRRYFRFLFWKGVIPFPWPPPNKSYILIPRRSFLRDTLVEFEKGFKDRMLRRYVAYLTGKGRLKLATE
ncbi:MAG: hypothetical protein GTN69_06940 [Armatimonadetes bacterium]|nr:hypothetical protein [Armatimonadota bacterium]